jgi:muramoyltetrapeptide carboxypeptidase
MIMSLELAGVFNKIKGLIVGGMTNMGDEKDNKDYEASFDEFAYKLISEEFQNINFR